MVELGLPEQMGYDRAIVVFSPEGRLYQVEYADQAVKKGKTCVGIVFKKGVVLAAANPLSPLEVASKSKKVNPIDDHIGAVTSGFVGDSRVLIDFLRLQAQIHMLTYGEHISTFSLAKKLADRMQLFTQFAGARPYGASVLLAGVNEEPALYMIHPSGNLNQWKAKAIGRGDTIAQKMLEQKWVEGMGEKEAIELAYEVILKGESKFGKIDKKDIELMIVRGVDKEKEKEFL